MPQFALAPILDVDAGEATAATAAAAPTGAEPPPGSDMAPVMATNALLGSGDQIRHVPSQPDPPEHSSGQGERFDMTKRQNEL